MKPYHKSIKTLPIANYNAINESNNLGYLFGGDFLEVERMQAKPEMMPVWEGIVDEYESVISKRNTASSILRLMSKKMKLISEREMIHFCCNQILLGREPKEYIKALNNTDYPINPNKDLLKQTELIKHRSDNLISKANEKDDDIKLLSGTSKENSFEAMVISIKKVLNIDVDKFRCTTIQFLEIENDLINTIEQRKIKDNGSRTR